MTKWLRRLAILLLPMLVSAASRASPLEFNLGGYDKPTVLEGVGSLRACTITYLLQNCVTNDTYAARMQFTPAPDAIPVGAQMPCPALVPPLVAETALNECREHAAGKADCVFADMDRDFPGKPELANTSRECVALPVRQGFGDRGRLPGFRRLHGVQCRLRRGLARRDCRRPQPLRGDAPEHLHDHGRASGGGPIARPVGGGWTGISPARPRATATEWTSCQASFKCSAVSKKARRG